jgi:lactoylglutathione lyase
MDRPGVLKDLRFRIHHTMLPVADMERSIGFYTGLLGMAVAERHTSEARQVEVGLVGYGDAASQPVLELIQDISDGAPPRVTPANIHIAIDVNDLRRLCTVLQEEGVEFMRPLKPSSRPGSRNLTAWIRDPDGHEIELAERHPDA